MDIQRPDGEATTVEMVIQPITSADGGSALVAIARDIGERIEVQVRLQRLAQAEHARAAELNAVIRAMGEAVVVCAADGTITLTNPAGEQIFPDVEEQTYADILAQLHDPAGAAPALGMPGGPVVLPTRDDPDRWIEIATYPVTVGVGLATAGEETIVVLRDVTEARRREAVRETFIGVLSHELRTPVTTIFGGAKLLAREHSTLDEETRRGIFRDIHEEAERLQRLVEDVVALNRFGEDAGDIGWEPVLLQRLLPRVVGIRGGALAGRDVPTRHRGRAWRPSSPIRPMSSRSSATCCPMPRNMAAPARPSPWRPNRARARSWSRCSTTVPGSRPRRRPGCSSCSIVHRARPDRRAAPGSGCSCAPGWSVPWVAGSGPMPRPEGGAEFGFALLELEE